MKDALDALISKGFRDLEHMAQEYPRLKAVEEAARCVIGETVITERGEFAVFEDHWVQVEKFAVEALRAALERKTELLQAK